MSARPGSSKRNVTQASAWVTYLLLAIGMIGPVVCVVWLARKAVENENAVVRRLVAEADASKLASAEKTLIASLASFAASGEHGGQRVSWGEQTYAVGEEEQRMAREVLQSVRERLDGVGGRESQAIVAEILQDESRVGLRLEGGRAIGPMLLQMPLERSGEDGDFDQEFLAAADRYVADFARSDSPQSQRRYLIRRYAPFSNSPEIREMLEWTELVEGWQTELERGGDFPPEPGLGRTSAAFHVSRESTSEALVFPLASLRQIVAGIPELEDEGIELALAKPLATDDEWVDRRLEGPLDFAWLRKRSSDETAEVSSDRALLYLWIGGIVLALSVVSGVAIVFSLRRQASVTQLKDNLVATVTHELKTPVSSIRLLVDTLLDDSKRGKVDEREYIELISRENQRLGRLIDNFLSFSRMERAKGSFDIQPISAVAVAQAAESAFRERFAGQAFELEVRLEADMPEIAGDGDALATVLGNLLENALKYGGADRRIELTVRAGEQGAEFAVRDFGGGIARRDRKRIFRKFYQASQSRGGHSGGVGLGLSIVEFIVSRHSGQVELESELGKGSVFKVRIPYA